ncbi:MAG: YccF domain-containing protein [Oscillospiraceae bacterium]|nr:YccF domain-containing protein [Oscillospiraceae bacterium]
MRLIGNILWALTVGLLLFLCWAVVGLLWCASIVGIPVGVQCFKFAGLMFAPFGKEIVYGTGAGSLLLNILWIVFGGAEIAVTSAAVGLVLCVTVLGIPAGLQCFKLAQLALLPFGAKVR